MKTTERLDLVERPRRLRRTAGIRRLVREHEVSPSQLIAPMFLVPGNGVRNEVASMPGVCQTSVDEALRDAAVLARGGVGGILLFGIPESKDARGSGAWDRNGIVQQGIRALKKELPDLTVITDVCLCEYTEHGHCGLLDGEEIRNDPTVELLALTALSHAEAGADIIAPSDMMDGRIGAIRRRLDAEGFDDRAIMSYAVKYASAFYGPFRDAAGSTPSFGDRRSHQMDPANAREALREARLDLEEGADIIMVKPAMPYLDIIHELRDRVDVPIAAYQVSGEYAMLHAAARNGWLDLDRVMEESLVGIIRAGASIVITYFAAKMAAERG